MPAIKLFKIGGNGCKELPGTSVQLEKSLQRLIDAHLPSLFGVEFLETEYSTGKRHAGRIDTLGIDENRSPIIIEYKRALNENVINQGLFYLDWLMDHQAEFERLVMKKLGAKAPKEIDWTSPRLICIAGSFTNYDEHAVQQIDRNIELVRYVRYGDDLLLLEVVNAQTQERTESPSKGKAKAKGGSKRSPESRVVQMLASADKDLQDVFEALKAFLLALGDDVAMEPKKYYFAFRRMKNFVCVDVRPQTGAILAYVKLDPAQLKLEKGFTRDMREIGHYGTGDLEITIANMDDLERAKPLLLKSYEIG